MSDNPFSAPAAPSAGIDWSDNIGRLLYIEPLSVETGIKTSFGDADAIRANVAVIDGDDAPTEYPDCLIFPKVLQSQLRTKVGEKVLGRLSQGTAKPGQSPPWLLDAATPADIEVGNRWVAHLEKRAAEQPAKNAAVLAAAAEATGAAPAASTPF